MARRRPTASGSAYCSPVKPATKRPPRISPRASMRRKTRSSSRHGGSNDSRSTRRRKRIPQRLRSTMATSSRISSFTNSSAATLEGGSINTQRPASSTPTVAVVRRRRPPGRSGRRRSDGTRRARNPVKLSELTQPAATSSASADSTCVRSRPVVRMMSSKNDAPWRSRDSRTLWALGDKRSSPCDSRAPHTCTRERCRNAMGDVRTGPGLRPRLERVGGSLLRGVERGRERRAHVQRPDRHSASSHCES